MCTLMEKDALIEKVASTQAFLARFNFSVRTAEQEQMAQLRSYLYGTKPENINIENILAQCKDVENKYKNANEYN